MDYHGNGPFSSAIHQNTTSPSINNATVENIYYGNNSSPVTVHQNTTSLPNNNAMMENVHRNYNRSSNIGLLAINGTHYHNLFKLKTLNMNSRNLTASPHPHTPKKEVKSKDNHQEIQKDLSTKSEIYKMHTNGLMLLHPQHSSNGNSAKKSQLATSSDDNAVNYHIWKKSDKSTNQSSLIAENEHFLETKLGNLPQIQEGKRNTIIDAENHNDIDIEKKDEIEIKCTENISKCPRLYKSTERDINSRKKTLLPTTKRNKINRSLMRFSRSSDDPLFDDDQPEQILRQYTEKRRLERLKTRYGDADSRGIPDIPAIKPIPNIRNRFETIEPLEHVPRFSDFGPALDNMPRFGVPELSLDLVPRFPAPKLDEFEQIPGIPHIRPLSRGDEVTGDKRGYPAKTDDEFYDQELDEDVEHGSPITSPTSIPFLTNIPDIPDIQDIPTISPAAAVRKSSGGVNGKTPVIDTVNTKEGQETRVSA